MNGIAAACDGFLAADGELRYTSEGTPVCNFSVAAFDSKRAEGQPAEWLKVAVWGDLAEELAPRLTKGAEVFVRGRLKLATWDGPDGQPRSGLNLTAYECVVKAPVGKRSYPQSRAAKVGAAATRW